MSLSTPEGLEQGTNHAELKLGQSQSSPASLSRSSSKKHSFLELIDRQGSQSWADHDSSDEDQPLQIQPGGHEYDGGLNMDDDDEAENLPAVMSKIPDHPPFKIYIGNLSFKVHENDLYDVFSDCNVIHATVIKDRESGNSKGFGFIEFRDRESLVMAVQKNGVPLYGRSCRIDIDIEERPERGPRSFDRNDREFGHGFSKQGPFTSPTKGGRYGFQGGGRNPGRGGFNVGGRGGYDAGGRGGYDAPGRGGYDAPGRGGYDAGGRGGYDTGGRGGYDKGQSPRKSNSSRVRFDERRHENERRLSNKSNSSQGSFNSSIRETSSQGSLSQAALGSPSGLGERRPMGANFRGGQYFNHQEDRQLMPPPPPIDVPKKRTPPTPTKPIPTAPPNGPVSPPKERPKLNLQPRTKPIDASVEEPHKNTAIFGAGKAHDQKAYESLLEQKEREAKERETQEREAKKKAEEPDSSVPQSTNITHTPKILKNEGRELENSNHGSSDAHAASETATNNDSHKQLNGNHSWPTSEDLHCNEPAIQEDPVEENKPKLWESAEARGWTEAETSGHPSRHRTGSGDKGGKRGGHHNRGFGDRGHSERGGRGSGRGQRSGGKRGRGNGKENHWNHEQEQESGDKSGRGGRARAGRSGGRDSRRLGAQGSNVQPVTILTKDQSDNNQSKVHEGNGTNTPNKQVSHGSSDKKTKQTKSPPQEPLPARVTNAFSALNMDDDSDS